MIKLQPSITWTTHTLPLDKLSPRDFERLCLWLVEREGYECVEYLGAAGSEQGRDIVTWREGEQWVFQCKRVRSFGPQAALTEVEKVLALPKDQRPVGLVFLITCDVSANTRQQARERCAGQMECHFWAGTELDAKVKRHPNILQEFFGAISIHLPTPLHQIPADLPDFTGRAQEVRDLLALLDQGAGGTARTAIVGMGGVGKSALAVHVAHQLGEIYPDAQIVVDLRGTSEQPLTSSEAMCRVIHAFQPEVSLPEDPDQVTAHYRSILTGKRALLLLDNAADADQVRPLLPPPPCGLIITSRRALVLPGLWSFNLDVLSPEEARDLLIYIVGQDRATEAELEKIAELCGRLPLALRVAGSFLGVHPDWSATEYLQDLTREPARLRCEALDMESTRGLNAAQLLEQLVKIPAGRNHWRDYEDICISILNYAFIPPFRTPYIQSVSEDRLDRRDAIYPISIGDPIWNRIQSECGTRMVVAEFKNSTDAPGQKEVESIQQYLFPKAMRSLGILCARSPAGDAALKARRRAWVEFGKLIILLCDNDLQEILLLRTKGENPAQIIDAQIDEFFMSLCP